MPSTDLASLSPHQLIPDRPFTHPAHCAAERDILRSMVDILCIRLESMSPQQLRPLPVVIFHTGHDGQEQRIVINQPAKLWLGGLMTLVGFFGQKNANADLTPLRNRLDKALINEFTEHPDLLSYSTLELGDGNFGNLILFARPKAKDRWSESQTHRRAVETLAPAYYASVRLYNGLLPAGIAASRGLVLTQVKYYDYSGPRPWRAIRILATDA